MSDDESPDGEDRADRNDPFDRLGYDTEREGDPFERLDDEGAGAGGDDAGADGEHAGAGRDDAQPVDGDPWVPPGADRRDSTAPDDSGGTEPAGTPATEADAANPAAGVSPADATAVDDPADPFANVDTPSGSPFDGGESVFERADAGAVDPDQVWESITGEDDEDDAAEPSVPDDGRYSDVSKHRFCEQCEHFSPPPDVSCGHHSAEIIEFLDMETVRLLDCPVVAEHEELEQGE